MHLGIMTTIWRKREKGNHELQPVCNFVNLNLFSGGGLTGLYLSINICPCICSPAADVSSDAGGKNMQCSKQVSFFITGYGRLTGTDTKMRMQFLSPKIWVDMRPKHQGAGKGVDHCQMHVRGCFCGLCFVSIILRYTHLSFTQDFCLAKKKGNITLKLGGLSHYKGHDLHHETWCSMICIKE